MPLVLSGIRFESLPETWPYEQIFPKLTYEQCVELERYYDKYYTGHMVGGKRLRTPIDRFQWQTYFTTPNKKTAENIFCNVIACWKTAQQNFEHFGMPFFKLTQRSGSKESNTRMLEYHNAMKADASRAAAAAAALALLSGSLGEPGATCDSDPESDGGESEILARTLARRLVTGSDYLRARIAVGAGSVGAGNGGGAGSRR